MTSNQVQIWELIKVLHLLFGHRDELVNILKKVQILPKDQLTKTISEDQVESFYEIFSLGNCLLLINNQKLTISKKSVKKRPQESIFEIAATEIYLASGNSPTISVSHILSLGEQNSFIYHEWKLLKNESQILRGMRVIKIDLKWYIDQLLEAIEFLEEKRISNKLFYEFESP